MATTSTNKTFSVSLETLKINYEALKSFVDESTIDPKTLPLLFTNANELFNHYQGARYPIELVSHSIQVIAELINEPNLGLLLASRIRKSHDLFNALISDVNLSNRDYFLAMARYVQICTEVFTLNVHATNKTIKITLNPNSPTTINYHQVEGFSNILVLMTADRHSSFNKIRLSKVTFTHAAPDQASHHAVIYENQFGITPLFESEENALYFDNHNEDAFSAESALSDISIHNIQRIEARYQKEFGENYGARCVFLLKLLLCLGEPNKDTLANILALTPRTLQRRLKEEGTSFRQLLKDLRIQLAKEYLKEHHMNGEKLAFALGYRDSSQFFKNFRDWFGMSPAEYRKINRL